MTSPTIPDWIKEGDKYCVENPVDTYMLCITALDKEITVPNDTILSYLGFTDNDFMFFQIIGSRLNGKIVFIRRAYMNQYVKAVQEERNDPD